MAVEQSVCNRNHILIMKKIAHIVLILLIMTQAAGCSFPGSAAFRKSSDHDSHCLHHPWPHAQSDLTPDPAIRFGRLANGLGYVIMENHEPRDRVGLYLLVRAGSLQETDDQRGLAHFLEHMLFEGSTHFPPGTLVDYFQSIGMSFGADTNAHTGYDETVYNILLPDGHRPTLDKGLLVLADYAGGALLLPEEIEQEKGVILAEKRARDSAGFRLREKRFAFLFNGLRATERTPIGIEETIKKADRSRLLNYYQTWYRPENMVVVVVGDMNRKDVEELIHSRFQHLTTSGGVSCPDMGRVLHGEVEYFHHYEPELGATEVAIESVWNVRPGPDTLERETERLTEYAASGIMNHRLKKLVNRPGSPLTDAVVYSGIFLQRAGYVAVVAETEPENWQQGMELLNKALRRALRYGFTAREVERIKREMRAELDDEVAKAATRDSRRLARQIIRKLVDNEVVLSPKQEKELFTEVIDSFSITTLNRAFRSLWSHNNRLIQVTGNCLIDADPKAAKEKIAAAYQASSALTLAPPAVEPDPVFPYLDPPSRPARILSREEFSGIAAGRFVLEKNVIVNYKATDFKKNEIMVSVNFGGGLLSRPRPGLAVLAEGVVRESGLGSLTRDELEEALSGHDIKLHFKVGEESFVFTGHALQKDLALLFTLIRTSLQDPAFRPEAYRRTMLRLKQMYEQLPNTVEGVMALRGERFLAGGNGRYGRPAWEEVEKSTLDDVRDWLAPAFAEAALEISVVGDFDPAKLRETAAACLGPMARTRMTVPRGEAIRFPSSTRRLLPVKSVIDRGEVVVAWPTADFWNIGRTRRLHTLAAVLDDRLRKEVREKLGATYSPVVYNRPSRVDPGYGVMRAELIIDPAASETIVSAVHDVVARLTEEGVTEEELQRTIGPTLTAIKDSMRTNSYWLHSVLKLSSRHPQQLEWPLSIKEDFSAVTARELTELARKYLGKQRAAVLILKPQP